MVSVYNVKYYDPLEDAWIVYPAKCTRARIELILTGEIIPGTEEIVREDEIDAFGQYLPSIGRPVAQDMPATLF
ncbi:hypothetical protein ACLBXM_11575 [Xanthobacteraceae bacterium A53D]